MTMRAAPRATSARAAARPAKRAPQTSTARPANWSATADEFGVEQPHAERDRDPGDDPEADDDRHFLPARHLEVMMQGRHLEDASPRPGFPAGELEPASLQETR